jgi:hypothetical protein
MTSRVRCSALAVAISSVALASAAVAQVKVELGATIGHYSPLGSFGPASVYSTNLPGDPDALSGSALGGQLRLWVAPRIGLQLAATTTSSTVGGGGTPEGEAPTTSARVSTGSVQLLFRLTNDGSRARAWFGAGGGAIQHGGATYAPFGKPVNYGAVFGLGSAIRLAGGLSADLGVTSMVYDLDIRGTPQTDVGLREHGRQVDMLMQTGLSYSWH